MNLSTITDHLTTGRIHIDKARDGLKRDESDDDRARAYAADVAMDAVRKGIDCLALLSATYKVRELPHNEIVLLRCIASKAWQWAQTTDAIGQARCMKEFTDALAAHQKAFPDVKLWEKK